MKEVIYDEQPAEQLADLCRRRASGCTITLTGDARTLAAAGNEAATVLSRDGFAVLRDPIACKPAVMAETDQYVAFGSEYRALVNLPGIEDARVWEPEPATVYFWER